MTLPIIHMNGTGHWTLLKGYHAALDAARDARKALNEVEFNSRDYYPHPDGIAAWDKALAERQALFASLDSVIEALETHVQHIDEVIALRGTI